MQIKEALSIFQQKYSGREVIGYWQDGDDCILNAKPTYPETSYTEPCQFIVKSDGKVIPTNPMRCDAIVAEKMIKL